MGHESNNNPEQSELPDIGKIEQLKQRLREIENAITEAEGIPSEEVAAAVIDKKQQEIVECNARKVELEMEIQENLESLMGKLANESNALADGRALALMRISVHLKRKSAQLKMQLRRIGVLCRS